MHNLELELITTLTAGLAAALVLGYVTHRLGLSPIVGYLLAGIVIGPNTPGFVANRNLADQLAEVGVILLMFGVGLHFHFQDLLAVRRVAVPGAIGQSLVATFLGWLVGRWLGWTNAEGLVFGLAVSVASTVVLLRVLADHNDLHTPAGHIAIGWLIVEDLFTVLVLVLLPAIVQPGAAGVGGLIVALVWAVAKIGLLVAVVFVGGRRLVPWLLTRVAATHSRELFTLTILVTALGVAVGSAAMFGVSMALGAFLAGMVVGQSEFSSRAAAEALPMRDAFAVLFFVSVGMLFRPGDLLAAPGVVVATLGIVLIGKPLAAVAIVLGLRYPPRVALAVAAALAQIGEFSFILAALGRELDVLSPRASNALVAVAIVSISINPLLYRLTDALDVLARRSPRLRQWLTAGLRKAVPAAPAVIDEEGAANGRAVVVGYGPLGRTLVRLLQENEVEPTVVELNLETVHRLRAHGLRAVYGDATHPETAREAGADRADAVILTSAGMKGSEEAIRVARAMNPRVRVFARANYLREIPGLRRAGADAVFAGEGEVALAMTEFILRRLGAGGDQLDRERDRIRRELFGTPLAIEILMPPPEPHVDDKHLIEPPPSPPRG
jgi:CPA2 family monovalent cation:H+ antiporter-2